MTGNSATSHTATSRLAYDSVGDGRLVVALPGAGDLRSEYRFVMDDLVAAGCRVVVADLPGHGEAPTAGEYTVASTADAIIELIDRLDAGTAVIVGTSFAPAAAIWAATERPDLVDGIVAISPHLHADRSVRGRLVGLVTHFLLRGPWAASAWAMLYRSWHKSTPPPDLDAELARMRAMLADPGRRRAVRRTLTAGRDGMDARIAMLDLPSLVVFGSADDHFPDPAAEAAAVGASLHGEHVVVDGAGHYPHVEQPALVSRAITTFLDEL